MNGRKMLSIRVLLAVLILGAIALALPAGVVAAQAPTPQTDSAKKVGNLFDLRLERALRRDRDTQKRLTQDSHWLDRHVQKAETRIQEALDTGKDVAALQDALTTFQAKLSEAQSKLDATSVILAAPNGFDSNGNVVDRAAAKETLAGVHDQFKEIRTIARDGLKDLRTAFKDWRSAQPAPTTP